MVKLERAPGFHPEILKQTETGEEKPKKMSEMNALEFETAILDGGLNLADFKVFYKAKEILGEAHPLVRAAHNLESKKGDTAKQIHEAVEKYKKAQQELQAIKAEQYANKQRDNLDFKKAA